MCFFKPKAKLLKVKGFIWRPYYLDGNFLQEVNFLFLWRGNYKCDWFAFAYARVTDASSLLLSSLPCDFFKHFVSFWGFAWFSDVQVNYDFFDRGWSIGSSSQFLIMLPQQLRLPPLNLWAVQFRLSKRRIQNCLVTDAFRVFDHPSRLAAFLASVFSIFTILPCFPMFFSACNDARFPSLVFRLDTPCLSG